MLGVDLSVRAFSARCFGFIACSPRYEDRHFQRVSSTDIFRGFPRLFLYKSFFFRCCQLIRWSLGLLLSWCTSNGCVKTKFGLVWILRCVSGSRVAWSGLGYFDVSFWFVCLLLIFASRQTRLLCTLGFSWSVETFWFIYSLLVSLTWSVFMLLARVSQP